MLRGRFALIKATGVIPDIIPFVPTLFTKQPKPLWLKYYPEDRRKIEVGGHDTRRLFLSLLDKIDKKALKEYKRENHTSNETD